ncbi:hypothetical protein QC763_301250 [Podospora pseudopauciseta]|uniref:Uncharacterized protein n=1 Tax=Podospora pseudopauciseta TaxID=2093780 RepID=A0ABR0HEW3_9PEZI|nr:hypothetical protein QC763_301250 [Podospora pseudopauciseta]
MSLTNWLFTPFPPLPATILPNAAFWNATNPVNNITYQIQVSWPFEWSSRNVANKTALSILDERYVLDGNALAGTASEAFKRRKPVSFSQPDAVVISVGYPLTDSVYDLSQRATDFRPPLSTPQTPPSGADPFLAFLTSSLRPFVKSTVFPNINFTRDALYGHSFGGLFVLWSLIQNPNNFDTYLSASPALDWNNASLLNDITTRLGNGIDIPGELYSSNLTSSKLSKPAVMITYGEIEQFPQRKRTETEAEFQFRKNFIQPFKMTRYAREAFDRIEGSGRVRDVAVKEYKGQDHSSVGASAVNDGVDYFIDW